MQSAWSTYNFLLVRARASFKEGKKCVRRRAIEQERKDACVEPREVGPSYTDWLSSTAESSLFRLCNYYMRLRTKPVRCFFFTLKQQAYSGNQRRPHTWLTWRGGLDKRICVTRLRYASSEWINHRVAARPVAAQIPIAKRDNKLPCPNESQKVLRAENG